MSFGPFSRPVCSISCCSQEDADLIQDLIRNRLRTGFGLSLSSSKVGGRCSSSICRTPGRPERQNRIFRRPLRDMSMIYEPMDRQQPEKCDSILVPRFLSVVGEFLEKEQTLTIEGIFRKSGSSARQKSLRDRLEASGPDSWSKVLEDIGQPLDVAAVLKQWLREMPEPIVPRQFQQLFLDCFQPLSDPSDRIESLLLSTCLLPPNHSATLIYLCRFFARVASRSKENKMDIANLAIVLTPTFFPMDEGDASKRSSSSNTSNLNVKTEIVEALFTNATRVGILPDDLEEAFAEASAAVASQAASAGTSSDHIVQDLYGVAGPSERRRKKKQHHKRRSGSLSRVLTATVKGLQKAMSRTATPVRSSFYDESIHFTPAATTKSSSSNALFTSPRLPVKRKAKEHNHEMSPNSKQQRKIALESAAAAATPKIRGRTFAGKKKATNPGENSSQLISFSPLPNKSTTFLSVATPGASNMSDLPQEGTDIASPEDEEEINKEVEVKKVLHEDFENAAKEEPERLSRAVTRKSSSMRGPERRQRSPSERKIGIVRRRSQEMQARKLIRERAAANGGSHENILQTSKPTLTDVQKLLEIRSQLRNGKPTKAMSASTMAKPAAPVRATESLTNLKQDIGSLIEQSFGCGNDEADGSKGSVQDIVSKIENVSLQNKNSNMRRQSSAFEFSRSKRPLTRELRRQSSAFEVFAKNKDSAIAKMEEDPIYENFGRVETRASLRRRNSSVKDLIKKIESKPPAPAPPKTSKKTTVSSTAPSTSATQGNQKMPPPKQPQNEDEIWTDATDFFKNPGIPALPKHLRQDDLMASGCKRSSIIKIRQQNKGKVIKSVETFTKPQPVSTPGNRRLSARMGVATATTPIARTASAVPKPATVASANRRQTLTGIRTSCKPQPQYENVKNSPKIHTAKPSPKPAKNQENLYENVDSRRTNIVAHQKASRAKRIEGRRHLTIGYAGEAVVRSPLKERQNIVVTVQRSKSAQTPLQKNNRAKPKSTPPSGDIHPMVRRSHSLKVDTPEAIAVPKELRETIYDVTTPKSEKVKRQMSDRIVTPGRKRHPMIKSALASNAMTPRNRLIFATTVKQETPSKPFKITHTPRATKLY